MCFSYQPKILYISFKNMLNIIIRFTNNLTFRLHLGILALMVIFETNIMNKIQTVLKKTNIEISET